MTLAARGLRSPPQPQASGRWRSLWASTSSSSRITHGCWDVLAGGRPDDGPGEGGAQGRGQHTERQYLGTGDQHGWLSLQSPCWAPEQAWAPDGGCQGQMRGLCQRSGPHQELG